MYEVSVLCNQNPECKEISYHSPTRIVMIKSGCSYNPGTPGTHIIYEKTEATPVETKKDLPYYSPADCEALCQANQLCLNFQLTINRDECQLFGK